MGADEKKVIRTVLGDIFSEDLGFTLPHEHLLLDFSFMFKTYFLVPPKKPAFLNPKSSPPAPEKRDKTVGFIFFNYE